MSQDSQVRLPSWRSIGAEVLQWTHNTLMMVGFFVIAAGAYLYMHPQSMFSIEHGVVQWVAARRLAMQDLKSLGAQADAAQARADAQAQAVGTQLPPLPPLDPAQRAVADWLARRYSIAPPAMSELVAGAWAAGRREHLNPTLILAVMAIESSFNPYAQSAVGATGLMQVMADVHRDKFAPYGGPRASLDPLTNVRVGAVVLRNAIDRGGSLQAGLRMYVGASSQEAEGGYASKVLSEQARLEQIVASARARGAAHGAPQTAATRAQPKTQVRAQPQTQTASNDAAGGAQGEQPALPAAT
ncbi:MAG: transglycosylase SLT domain-containing protein [Betaproteobacteria bacterium]|nr:transglycosylase SLT domain-containing protein [Betaproteobacteria bacterium]